MKRGSTEGARKFFFYRLFPLLAIIFLIIAIDKKMDQIYTLDNLDYIEGSIIRYDTYRLKNTPDYTINLTLDNNITYKVPERLSSATRSIKANLIDKFRHEDNISTKLYYKEWWLFGINNIIYQIEIDGEEYYTLEFFQKLTYSEFSTFFGISLFWVVLIFGNLIAEKFEHYKQQKQYKWELEKRNKKRFAKKRDFN